jgi:hypothetical protein
VKWRGALSLATVAAEPPANAWRNSHVKNFSNRHFFQQMDANDLGRIANIGQEKIYDHS